MSGTNPSISVVLNGFRRPEQLGEQLNSLNSGSISPNEILLWYNDPGPSLEVNHEVSASVVSAVCNHNLGVWARFAFALNAKSEFICVFDDDTIPGKLWLENCLSTFENHPGLIGTVGLLYENPNSPEQSSYFERYQRIGWPDGGNREHAVEVDFVGHSWFFKKEWLSYMWREIPEPKYCLCGEDMHFSFMLQKYAGIKTFVAPHPVSNIELWGSTKAKIYGADSNSLWQSNVPGPDGTPVRSLMNTFFQNQRNRGWKLVNER